MESKRITCPHCDFLFYHEEGVTVDDCPVCGRTVEVKPARAPLPILVEATLKGIGHDYPGAECTLRAHISDLTRRLAEAEAELETMRAVVRERTQSAYEAACRARRAEAAEARVGEMEAFKARVMAWARGRCECCKYERGRYTTSPNVPCNGCMFSNKGSRMVDNWVLRPVWEVEE